MKSYYIVMNNYYIRNIIFSYLRKEPKIKCKKCNIVCVWDKKINEYVEFNFYPWCKKCFYNLYSDTPFLEMNLYYPHCIII
jgi:hypothetical protein